MLSRSAGKLQGGLSPFIRGYASVASANKYTVGNEIAGYVVNRVLPVPEFNLTAVDLTHKFSGAKHLHIDRQDRNNVFGVIVKTNPPDNSGLPHMLEHTTLCGSDKYPVRDPFFKMLNRSLANFMNAMTGHDYTYFPFATTNKVDFENLMDVYLDSVFHPLMTQEDFRQEGWRLEHEDPKDRNSPLIFKGVVYNEMKGQISDPSYYFWINFQKSIYPSLNNSGGDPSAIVNCYHDDLMHYQSSFYHPSNCCTYTYGPLSLENSLKKIDKAINTFGKRHYQNIIKQPISLDKIKSVEIPGPIDPMLPPEQQYKASLTWYTGKPTDIYESFVFKLLSTLLLDGHSSPLYQQLIERGIGTDFSANTGMEAMAAVNLFTIGLNGLTEENSAKLQDLVLDALNQVQKSGFPDTRIQGILHQLELGRRIESASFGLGLLNSLTPGIADNVDPLQSLKWNETISRFKKEYEAKGNKLFTELIDEFLLNKPYFKYTMRPDEKVPERLAEKEKQILDSRISRLSTNDRDVLYRKGIDLVNFQENRSEDLSCLPTLHTEDIGREGHFTRVKEHTKKGTLIQSHVSPKTNGVTYFRALKTLTADDLPRDLVKYLPLFSACLTNLGTREKSMSEIEDEVKLYTSGLSSAAFAHSSVFDPNEAFLKFTLDSACLDKDLPQMLSLWEQLIRDTNFRNVDKLDTLVRSLVTDNLSAIVSSGNSFATSYAGAQISAVGGIDESLGGIEQVKFLNDLGKVLENGELEVKVVPKLEQISQILLNASKFKYGITCSRGALRDTESQVLKFDGKFSESKDFAIKPYKTTSEGQVCDNTFVEIPSQTNFAASVLRGTDYVSRDGASLQILSQLLTFKYLHPQIREKGGAYGGGASYDALNGLFSFYSYRDPKPFESEKKFTDSTGVIHEKIENGDVTNEDLEHAKLSIFQKIDAAESVKDEGLPYFNFDVEDEVRQERRENLLDCSLADVAEVSGKYFGPERIKVNAIIGSESAADAGGSEWKRVKL
ncbi:DEKNAAC101868 [Brettanomyces naardenensis]|uniref:Presequence protease, mitochondrial n=1 Tax=Brettanomyces naardenensis TaxID=13370 RepID=A0A448YIW3_BRENA|nr:DEKNAAC101868 [Brettanomyces naardenensis]